LNNLLRRANAVRPYGIVCQFAIKNRVVFAAFFLQYFILQLLKNSGFSPLAVRIFYEPVKKIAKNGVNGKKLNIFF